MSRLLEIFGRAIEVGTADLIWHWLNEVKPSRQEGESSGYQQLDIVIELMGEMRLGAAQEQLRFYLFEHPCCTYGRLAAAAICLHKNRLHEAIEELNSVYLRQPNNTMALYVLGHCYERLGKESQAVEFYQDCLKFKNYLQLPAQRLAAIYFKNGQLEKAIQLYKLLKEQYPDDISALVTLGYLYMFGASYAEAIATFNTAILIHPDNFLTQDDCLVRLIHNGELHEALERLEDLLGQEPDRVDLIASEGDVLSMLGATAEAVSRYQQALRICPDFLEATIKLGTQYLQMHTEQLAAEQFNKAVEINDKIVDAYVGLATAHKLAGSDSDALATLALAAAIQPNSSFLFAETATLIFKTVLAGELAFQEGDDQTRLIEAVVEAHRQQIINQPQNPDLHYRMGLLMMSVSRISGAIESFQTALGINPTFSRARTKLAICLFQTGRKEDALEELTAPEHLDRDTLELHYKTALLYCDRVRFASSLFNLDRYMEHNFALAETAVNISIVLQNLGLLDRVAAMWENLSETADRAIDANQL